MIRRQFASTVLAVLTVAAAALGSAAPVRAVESIGLGPSDTGAVVAGPSDSTERPSRDELARETIVRGESARSEPVRELPVVAPAAPSRELLLVVGADEPARELPVVATGEPLPIEDAHFRLAVPFRTQKDGTRWQGSNCGPAVLGMVLDAFGVSGQDTDQLRFRAHTYQGTVGMRTGTALEHVAHVAEDFGLGTVGLYEPDERFHTWTVDEVRAQLRLGRPVVPLVRLYLVPGYEGSAPRWGHYILLTGLAPDGFYFSDPLQPDAGAGAGKLIGGAQLERAMANSHIPGQAVAFRGPAGAMLSIWSPPR